MQKMNLSLMVLCFLIAIGSVAQPAYSNQDHSQWLSYRNKKYRYEIRYPQTCELWLIGSKSERDGRQFRIGIKDIALHHGLDCHIRKNETLAQIAKEESAPTLQELTDKPLESTSKFHTFFWKKVTINGAPAIRGKVRFRENQQLFAITIIMDHVVFHAHLASTIGFDAKITEDIVSTFSFYK